MCSHMQVILPVLAVEATVSERVFFGMFKRLFESGSFGAAAPKIYAQTCLAPEAPEVCRAATLFS